MIEARTDRQTPASAPPGFLFGELGLLPDDWQVTTLGTLGRTLSGGTPRTSDARFWNGEIPWVSSKDMKVARLYDAIDHISSIALGNGTRLVQPGTILIVVRGMSLAHSFPVAVVERPLCFNQDIKAFVPHVDVHPEFILQWLQANQLHFLSLVTEATHGTKRIPTADLLRSYIPLPSLSEQTVIVEALSDVDRLLESMESLIAKKEIIKKATMHQLLSGKSRLPGFSREWGTKFLGEVGSFLRGRGIKRNDVSEEGLACIRYGELYTRYENYIQTPKSYISPAVAATALPINTNDILFAGSGETAVEIGRCAAYLGDAQAFAGGDIIVLRPAGHDSMFLSHLINCPIVAKQRARLGQGDAVVHISARSLAQIELHLPSPEEQIAISTVLSDMDDRNSCTEAAV